MKQLNKEEIVKQLTEFIKSYQASLWSSDCRKLPEQMIPIITVHDLIWKFGWDCSLHEFMEFINEKENADLKTLVNEFVANNFIHYSCSTKLKELLQEYRESNVMLERDTFNIDTSDINTFNDIGITCDQVSMNCGLASDIEGEAKDKVLSTVESFDEDK